MATAFRLLTRVQDAADFPASVTAGSVLYGGGAGVTQDNAGLYYDGTNHNLGVGVSGSNVKARIHGYIASGFQTYSTLSGGSQIVGHVLAAAHTDASGTSVSGFYADASYNPASNPGNKAVQSAVSSLFVPAANVVDFGSSTQLRAYNATANYQGVGTLGNTTGPTVRTMVCTASRSGTGTNPVSALEAGFFQVSNSNANSTVDSGIGVKVIAPVATGPITTVFAVYIDKQNAAQVGTAYGIYQKDAGDRNLLAGRLDVYGGQVGPMLSVDANAGNGNTGSAPILFSTTFSDTHTVSVFNGPAVYGSLTVTSSGLALFNCKHGNIGAYVPLGTKGILTCYEGNISTDQGQADMTEPPHGFGVTLAARGATVTSNATFNVTATAGAVSAAVVNSGGSGYPASTTVYVTLLAGNNSAVLSCTTNGSGVITAVGSIIVVGSGYTTTTGVASTPTGSGGRGAAYQLTLGTNGQNVGAGQVSYGVNINFTKHSPGGLDYGFYAHNDGSQTPTGAYYCDATWSYGADFGGGTFTQAAIRLPNNSYLASRNAAGTGNLNLIGLDATNTGASGVGLNVNGLAAQNARPTVNNTLPANYTASVAGLPYRVPAGVVITVAGGSLLRVAA